jgi:integrase
VLEDLIEQGIPISRKRVARLMQAEGLKARVRKRFRSTTMSDHDQPIAANVLDRQFVADRPNQRWVGDTTEFTIGNSAKLYLAAILLRSAEPHLQALIVAALETCGRLGELLTLQWGDVSLERGEIILRAEHTKDRENRILPISSRFRKVWR